MKVPALRIASLVGLIISACMSTGMSSGIADPELQDALSDPAVKALLK